MIEIPDTQDFMDLPEWQALHRESMLVQGLLCSAANAIGRAGYANRLGEYYTAFFGFSLGIERLSKLCIITDYALHNNGCFPSPKTVSGHRHKVKNLIDEVNSIVKRNGIKPRYPYPDFPVCEDIISCLHSFAEAKTGRYANFAALGNANFDPTKEPVNKWWVDVAEPILAKHFAGTKKQANAAKNAAKIHGTLGSFASVAHTNESGQVMTNLEDAAYRSSEIEIVQKYGRYYTLLIVRWLGSGLINYTGVATK